MRSTDNPFEGFGETIVPSNPMFTQAQVNRILGQSLASVYHDLLKAPLPNHLQALLDQLNEGHSSPGGGSRDGSGSTS